MLISSIRQEGEVYKRIRVAVTTSSGSQISCYTYVMCEDSDLSLPSKPYLDTLISGAVEHRLPSEYVHSLQIISHNGYMGPVTPP